MGSSATPIALPRTVLLPSQLWPKVRVSGCVHQIWAGCAPTPFFFHAAPCGGAGKGEVTLLEPGGRQDGEICCLHWFGDGHS